MTASSEPTYEISDDPARIDVEAVHAFLSRSYWAAGIPIELVRRSIANSLPFGVYRVGAGGAQVGFARVVTDRATFAYLADVYVLEEHRGRGLAARLVEAVLAHPVVRGVRRVMLVTRDAQGLYARFGFREPEGPGQVMQIRRPNPYGPPGAEGRG